jgi:hypothetical protein
MPGAEIERLYELRSTGEALKLAARVLLGLERDGASDPATAAPNDDGGPRPTTLAYRTLKSA